MKLSYLLHTQTLPKNVVVLKTEKFDKQQQKRSHGWIDSHKVSICNTRTSYYPVCKRLCGISFLGQDNIINSI